MIPIHNAMVITRSSVDKALAQSAIFVSTDCVDCACGLAEVTASEVSTSLSPIARLVQNGPTHSLEVTEDFSVLFGPFHDIAVVDAAAGKIWAQFEKPASLAELRLHPHQENVVKQFVKAGIIRRSSAMPRGFNEVTETLSVWLHLTDRCNLRCQYCYLPHEKKDMSLGTGISAIESAFRSAAKHGYKAVKLKYAGGEPLLDPSIIIQLHEYAVELGSRSGLGVFGVVLSNGTLINTKTARLLAKHQLQLAVSLDGIGDAHDQQRPYAGGKGSFSDVQQGITTALACNVALNISVTVTEKNARALGPLIKWIRKLNIPFSLNFFRNSDLTTAAEELSLQSDTIIEGMMEAYTELEKDIPNWSLLGSIVDRANLSAPHLKTCGVGSNYLVFDYKGNISKCQMEMGNVVTSSETKDPLLEVRLDSTGIRNLSVDDKDFCSDCNWRYWCAGGCPIMALRSAGSYARVSPHCSIYKALIPAALRLEGLRLLKLSGLVSSKDSIAWK